MNKKEFTEFERQKQKEIDQKMEEIDDIMAELAREAQKIYNGQGEDGFEATHSLEQYGVTNVDVSLPGRDGDGFYFFPPGLGGYYEGWVSSSEMC